MLMLRKCLNATIFAALTFSNLSGQTSFSANSEATSIPFALKLFGHEQAPENVLVSPFSAYSALTMAANGANGITRQDMATTLGFKTDEFDRVNRRNRHLMTARPNEGQPWKPTLEIANAIFANKDCAIKGSFKATCHEFYGAEARSLDYKSPKALATINNWCNEKTHGRIKTILDSLSPAEKMVLVNTVYFKGKWKDPFEKNATKPEPFLIGLKNPTKQTVNMMHAEGFFPYLKKADFRAVSLPYGAGEESLYVFLPEPNINVKTMLASFSDANWNSWMKSFEQDKIAISLPKVKVEYSTNLSATLKKIGMASAFSGADFSGMFESPGNGCISRVVQKTYIDINEGGTEAAAATAVTMLKSAMAPPAPRPSIPFKVDRPFVIALVDTESQEILFLGSISNPQSK